MLQFLIGVLFGIGLVLLIAYIIIIDPWAPSNNEALPRIDQFPPIQIPDELRNFLKSGEDGQGISRWESCNSISLLLHMLFQEHKDTRLLRRWVHKRLQMEMNDITTRSTAGRFIQEIRIRELSLGTKFMTINSIRVEKIDMGDDRNTFEKIVFILDIDYSGGFEMSIDVATIIAKQASLSVKITKLSGLVRVILSRQPYHHWTFSFVSQPIFETNINSQIQGHQLKKLIPVIKEAFRRSLQRKHVWPNYKIRYRPFFPNPIFQASPPINSFSHISMKGGIEVTVLQCSRLKNVMVNDKNKNYEVYCAVALDYKPLVQNEEQGHCVSVMLTFSRHEINTPIGIVFDKSTTGNGSTRPVRVLTVDDNSLADKAAFKPGDVLVAVNNVPIRSERQATRFLQQTVGDLMVLVERSLEDIDDEELKDEEIIVSSVRDIEEFELIRETNSTEKNEPEEDEEEAIIIEEKKIKKEDAENPEAIARRRHSVSNFESSPVDTNTESISSIFSLDGTRFEKPASILVQRTESARVPQLVISQPSFELRRTQSESRLDASKMIDAILGTETSTMMGISEENNLNRSAQRAENEPGSLLNVARKDDRDKTLTQADAAQGLMMLTSQTGSVASLDSTTSNRTDNTGTDNDYVEDEEASLSRKRALSTRRTKIQATWAAGKKRMMDLMPQKKKSETGWLLDVTGESIEIGADAGSMISLKENESGGVFSKKSSLEEKKEKKKLKKKLSDSPRTPVIRKNESVTSTTPKIIRTTKSVQFQRNVMWGQSLHFEIDSTSRLQRKYLNVTVYAKEMKRIITPNTSINQVGIIPPTPESLNSTTISESTSTSTSSSTGGGGGLEGSKPVVVGSVSLFIPQLIDDCNLTLSNCHREVFQLKQTSIVTTSTAVKDDPLLHEFSRHAGFDPRLCFGDITLGFRYFPNGLPSGTALNCGDESDDDEQGTSIERGGQTPGMNSTTSTTAEPSSSATSSSWLNGFVSGGSSVGRPFSPPLFSPATHDWKQWYGRNNSTCAMCSGKIWLRNASCCGRCLVICHNKCVVKANQGGIACTPQHAEKNDVQFEELTMPESLDLTENSEEPIGEESKILDSPSSSTISETRFDTSKRSARFRKVTEKFSNWRRGGSRRKEDDRQYRADGSDQAKSSSISAPSEIWSGESSTSSSNWIWPRDIKDNEKKAMISVTTVLADFLPNVRGSSMMHKICFQPGNAYNEHVINHTRELGREIFAELKAEERGEQINNEIDRIQKEIRETKDRRLNAQTNHGTTSPMFQELDLRLQALAVVMLHYCSALQELQSGRSTPVTNKEEENLEATVKEEDQESVVDEDTVTGEVPNVEETQKHERI